MIEKNKIQQIPKVIHYCWFGGKPLPEDAIKCINSWKKYFPDYEIQQWNEKNFDFSACAYAKEAYQAKKWAFVSDYARFWILYHYGGIYFDTDVEVIRDMRSLIAKGSFMGCEAGESRFENYNLGINPGLGIAALAGLNLYKEILECYQTLHFIKRDGDYNPLTVVDFTTEILKKYGFKGNGKIEWVDNIYIYPPEYFCPLNYYTGELNITENTYSIHHYTASWHTGIEKFLIKFLNCGRQKNPVNYKVRLLISVPLRVVAKVQKLGIGKTLKLIMCRIKCLPKK